jgi:hypothetical protein
MFTNTLFVSIHTEIWIYLIVSQRALAPKTGVAGHTEIERPSALD